MFFFLIESWKPQRKPRTKFSASKYVLSKITESKPFCDRDNFCHILDEVRCPDPDYSDTFIYSGPAPSGQEHELPHSFLLKDMFPKLRPWSLWRKARKQLLFKSVHCHTSICPFVSCSSPLSPGPPSVHGFNLICCSLGRMHSPTSFPRCFCFWHKKLKVSNEQKPPIQRTSVALQFTEVDHKSLPLQATALL